MVISNSSVNMSNWCMLANVLLPLRNIHVKCIVKVYIYRCKNNVHFIEFNTVFNSDIWTGVICTNPIPKGL